ncbi:SAM-dependent methyltransferase [Jidongwangia harbinensis]|uniref:SAM-dependent methyltransferase n=1 Tax=Jidongwangia harbinensis TaxID=2878561 RepID=UPI001CD988DF|nr:SAM-dependent methyltransferase [Jidongwangia harbinensis]MCA2218353.1 SAM-dependent methyltransferase [Jidongwangia harbinensis]
MTSEVSAHDEDHADREAAEQVLAFLPESAPTSGEFLARAVRHLVGQAGIRQFLDIGAERSDGDEPGPANVTDARVFSVDHNPMVLVHARAFQAIRDTDTILDAAGRTIDFSRPVAVLLRGTLTALPDDADARRLLEMLSTAVAPGSHLVVSHPAPESAAGRAAERWHTGAAGTTRDPDGIAALFTGWRLLEPGVVTCAQWRPDTPDSGPGGEYAGVARKPL